MGLLVVFFPENQTAASKPAVLSSSSPNSATKRANSSLLFSKAQSTISICLLFVFLTLLLFNLSTFEPSVPKPSAARTARRFLSHKQPSDSPPWLSAMRDFRTRDLNRRDDSRAPFALQKMGALFRRGTRAMNDLVVGHVVEDVSEDEFAMFLRLLHRSGITARADVVFVFGSPSLLSRFVPVIEEENRSFSKLVDRYKQNPISNRDSALGFDATQYVKHGKKEVAEPVWGKRARGNYNESLGEEEDESTRLSYGSVVGFEVDELDPENSLTGFLGHVPMSLRRWACYPLLLGRLRRNFKHIMLLDVKNLLVVGDPLGRVRNRTPESVYLYAKPGKKNSGVNPAVLMGGTRGIRRIANRMLTEIVRAAMQRKKKGSVSESEILSQLVGSGFTLKNVDLMTSNELIPEANSVGGASIIHRGNRDVNSMLRRRLCAVEADSSVYSDCE